MAKVLETDGYLKELFSIFKSHELLDNSTIIITSDHGDEFAEHGGLSHDGKMYSELVDVPLMVYDKSYKQTTIELLILNNIPPTICAMFGVASSPSLKENRYCRSKTLKLSNIYGESMGKLGHK